MSLKNTKNLAISKFKILEELPTYLEKKLTYQKIQSKYRIKTGNNIESYTKKQLRMPSLEEENRK